MNNWRQLHKTHGKVLPRLVVELAGVCAVAIASACRDNQPVNVTVYARATDEGAQTAITVRNDSGLAVIGDMIFGTIAQVEADGDTAKVKNGTAKGVIISGPNRKWVNGRVPYVISPALGGPARVTSAIAMWDASPEARFELVPRTAQDVDYIEFVQAQNPTRCRSYVGRQGGPQVIELGTGCATGSVAHEIGHALGLLHEQTRPDRNQFVTFIEANLDLSAAADCPAQFRVLPDFHPFGAVYDYGSIMHYGPLQCSGNGLPVLVAPQPIGQRIAPSSRDFETIAYIHALTGWSGEICPPPRPVIIRICAATVDEGVVAICRTDRPTIIWRSGDNEVVRFPSRAHFGPLLHLGAVSDGPVRMLIKYNGQVARRIDVNGRFSGVHTRYDRVDAGRCA